MVLRTPKWFKNKGGREGYYREEGAHHAGSAGAPLTAQVLLATILVQAGQKFCRHAAISPWFTWAGGLSGASKSGGLVYVAPKRDTLYQ